MSIFHNWMVQCSFYFHLNRSFVYVKCRRMEVLHISVSLSVIPFHCDCNHSERQVIFIQHCMLVLNLHSAPLDNIALFVNQLYCSTVLIKKRLASKQILHNYCRSGSLTCITSLSDIAFKSWRSKSRSKWFNPFPLDILLTCLHPSCSETLGLIQIKWCDVSVCISMGWVAVTHAISLSKSISTYADELIRAACWDETSRSGIVSIPAPKQMQIKIQINVFSPRRNWVVLIVSSQ